MNSNVLESKEGAVTVKVFVDKKHLEVPAGEITVAELKRLAEVPPAYELEEKVNGKLQPLPEGGTVKVKGGEHFFSHPRDGASSWF